MSFYSAAEEVAGDSGVQGAKRSRSGETAEARERHTGRSQNLWGLNPARALLLFRNVASVEIRKSITAEPS